MLPQWLLRFWMRRDVRRIIASLTPERRAELRATSESDLIRFHHSLGRGLRNSFRHGRFLGLSGFCHASVRRRGDSLSFDALSSVAIREVWLSLQSGIEFPVAGGLTTRSSEQRLAFGPFLFIMPLLASLCR